jgi:hypothetical protein
MPWDEDRQAWATSGPITSLVNTFGVSDGTIEDVTATPTQAAVNNNFRELSDKVNAILVAMRTAGLIETD